jgi:hypothetical protein
VPPWGGYKLLCAQKCLDPRQIFFRFTQPLQRFRLAGRKLKAEPENLLGQLFLLRLQLVFASFADFLNSPRHR